MYCAALTLALHNAAPHTACKLSQRSASFPRIMENVFHGAA
jgi:hypothetical protein